MTQNNRTSKNRHRLAAALMVALAALLLGAGAVPAFGQNGSQSGGPAAVTDYEAYPTGIIPDGCSAEGPAILTGTQYSLNDGAPVSDLSQLGLVPNTATVTMTWSGYAAGCEGVGVSLSRKISPSPTFVVSENQHLNAWVYCGPGGSACTGTLTLNLAQATPVACYQIDASAGPPLSVVGPNGSYYSDSLNGVRNMLLSANNGGTEPCVIEPCATNPSLPAGAAACAEAATTTTTTTTTTTPSAPTTTVQPAPSTTSGSQVPPTTTPIAASTTVARQASTTTARPPVVAASGGQLPFTGDRTGDYTTAGLALMGAGLLLIGATRKIRFSNGQD